MTGGIMRRLMALWGMVVALAAASPVLADDGVQLGATYRGILQLKTYGSPQVPLPPGDWKLVALGENRDRIGNTRMLQGFLIQVRTGVLAGRVIFDVPDAPSRGGWTRPAMCDRKNILVNFSQPEKAFGSYDCLTIEPVSMVRAATASQLAGQFYDYLDVNKIKRPNTAISTAFNISDGRSYLNVSYLFNPDLEKITPVAGSLWHIDRYKEDPKRAAYVDKIKTWAQNWRPQLADGLKGKLTAPASIASLPQAASATKPPLGIESPQIGKTYRDVLQLDTYGAPQIALPPGDWKLAVLGQLQSDRENIRLVRGYLIQTKGDTLAGNIYFIVPDGASSLGWGPADSCKRKEPLADYSVDRGSSKGYDCTSITSYSMARPKTGTSELLQLHDYLEANKIKKPATMINVAFGLSNRQTYVLTEYRFNPEMEGVRAENIAAWRSDRYREDSKRGAYVEKMKAWSQEWRIKFVSGYEAAAARQTSVR